MASWTADKIEQYHEYAKTYIESYNLKIDCADLALAALIDFAGLRRLPVRLKHYAKGWKWKVFDPEKGNANRFKGDALLMLGALNVIDNTVGVLIEQAKAGDLIMTKWSGTLGHTRIIYGVRLDEKVRKYEVTWYQGNLPPVVPEKRVDYFDNIGNVYGNSPRRWNFAQFDE